jgi:hypothetical protein
MKRAWTKLWQKLLQPCGYTGSVDCKRIVDQWRIRRMRGCEVRISRVAWYVTGRSRSELAKWPAELVPIAFLFYRKKRLAVTIGSWRRSPKSGAGR